MAETNGSADLDTLGVDWHDEQVQRVRAVFDAVNTDAADSVLRSKILGQVPDTGADLIAGVRVFRDLLRVEHRAERFRRLLRIWWGKVASGVRAGEWESAGMWMRALTDAPVFPEEYSNLVAEARRDLSWDGLFEELVVGLVAAENPEAAGALLASWGEPLVDYLVSQIVTDEPIVNRRHIVEFLGMAGREDVRHLTAHLEVLSYLGQLYVNQVAQRRLRVIGYAHSDAAIFLFAQPLMFFCVFQLAWQFAHLILPVC